MKTQECVSNLRTTFSNAEESGEYKVIVCVVVVKRGGLYVVYLS